MVVVGSTGGRHVCLPKTKSSIVGLQAKRDGVGREKYDLVLLTRHLFISSRKTHSFSGLVEHIYLKRLQKWKRENQVLAF
jgi:hypothetical protein